MNAVSGRERFAAVSAFWCPANGPFPSRAVDTVGRLGGCTAIDNGTDANRPNPPQGISQALTKANTALIAKRIAAGIER